MRRSGAENRLQYVDALRAGAIAMVFLVHVCSVFNPWDQWHIANDTRSRVAGEIAALAAPWVMPLIMLLAGVSAWHSLSRRDNRSYVRARVVRVLLPLVVGTLVFVPPQVYLERRLNGQFSGSFLAFYPHFFDGLYPQGNLSWHHLWFLAHLFLYSLITLPLFRYWQRPGRHVTLEWAARACATRGGILWLAVPLLLERNLLWGLFPERHMLTSDWSNHALLLVAYIYGFVLAGSPWLGQAIDRQWRRALIVGLMGTSILVIETWRGDWPGRLPPPYTGRYLTFWTLYALCAWGWIVAALGAGRRWLNRDGPSLEYARQCGYGLYVVHQPVIVAVAFVVVQWDVSLALKFLVVLVVSAIATVATAALLRRLPGASLIGLTPATSERRPLVHRIREGLATR